MNNGIMRVLLVEDDASLGDGVCVGLGQAGIAVTWVRYAREAIDALAANSFNVLILDLGLPDRDGISVLRMLRRQGTEVPVLILTARDAISDRVGGLDAGADDYLVKPFDLDELAARLRALARRDRESATHVLRQGDIVLNPDTHVVTLDGEPIDLTRGEFAVLHTLLGNRGRVISRSSLQESLYGWGDGAESNVVEVHIHHLRKKLGDDLIRTLRGIGYVIDRVSRTTSSPAVDREHK